MQCRESGGWKPGWEVLNVSERPFGAINTAKFAGRICRAGWQDSLEEFKHQMINQKIRGFRDRLLMYDPGLMGFKEALRGTAAVWVGFLLFTWLAGMRGYPTVMAFPGVMIALMMSLLVNERSIREQKKTVLWLILPGLTGLTLSILLGVNPIIQLSVFILIAFFAVFVRRYGARWFAGGLLCFMAYFFPIFFEVPLESTPFIIATVLVAAILVFTIRFYLFPVQPQQLFLRYLRTFNLHIGDILLHLERRINGELTEQEIQRTTREGGIVAKLNEFSMQVEQFLESTEDPVLRPRSESLQMSLFERELSVRAVVSEALTLSNLSKEHPELLPQLSEALHTARTVVLSEQVATAGLTLNECFGEMNIRKHAEIGRTVEHFCSNLRSAATTRALAILEAPEKRSSRRENLLERVSTPPTGQLHTRQAIQVTLSVMLSSVAGYLVSPERWYWAAVTAFVIFAGTSRGETVMRAFLRIVGTFVGLTAGFLLSYLTVYGPVTIVWILLLLCIFFGLYGSRKAFGFWSAVIFSMLLAFLFDVLGQFSLSILVVRLEETLLGALIGAVVSFFVLPVRTSDVFRSSVMTLYTELADILRSLPLREQGYSAKKELAQKMRKVDQQLLSLRTVAAPVINRLSLLPNKELSVYLHEVSMLTHFTRHLANYPVPEAADYTEQLRGYCHYLADVADGLGGEQPVVTAAERPVPELNDAFLRHLLERIQELLQSLREGMLRK